MSERIEVFQQMLEADPENTMVMFGLAKEYEKSGDDERLIEILEKYLSMSDDEGNAYGMLARAFVRRGETVKAKSAYKKGIEVSNAHGHPSMAMEYQEILEMDFS
ncbi:MAG: tetratricopeptide repeat protein [Pyrinomonadaceae bacterium]|nr:tetratricopeptide repeat protein [Pyrinomonadaceae bacterium]